MRIAFVTCLSLPDPIKDEGFLVNAIVQGNASAIGGNVRYLLSKYNGMNG